MATPNEEIDTVHTIHQAWKEAFEDTDIKTIEKFWSHGRDALLVTPLGNRHKSWAEVKAALKSMFGLLGPTTLEISDKFITVDGAQASITMHYQWSPAFGMVFPLTEHYQKADGEWKLHLSDSFNNPQPLRPDDALRVAGARTRRKTDIKQLASKVRNRVIAQDIASIAELVAADFTYTAPNGQQIDEWEVIAGTLEADISQVIELQLQWIALKDNKAPLRGIQSDLRAIHIDTSRWKHAAHSLHLCRSQMES
jgi:ketosteroid isomerase-like protein